MIKFQLDFNLKVFAKAWQHYIDACVNNMKFPTFSSSEKV